MKILFVNNFRSRGGGEEHLLELLPGLIRKGVHVGLVCRPNSPLAGMFSNVRLDVYPIEKSGFRGLTSFIKIAKIINNTGYEIICIQRGHDILQAWIAALLSRTRPSLVHTIHVADFIKIRFLLARLHGIVAISRHIRQKILDYYPALSDRVAIIHNGINLSAFNSKKGRTGFIRNRFGLSEGTPLISTSGVMWKNQIEFLDALVLIKKEIPKVRYLLLTSIKSIPQIQEFKERAAQLGLLDTVLWLDNLPKEDMPAYYSDLDLVVSTFRNEGFGLWVIEALAMGTPVAAFDEGGVRDSLEGCPAALLIKTGAKDMAVGVVRILKDKELRKRMSESGPLWVAERFSSERMVEDYYQYFETLVRR